MLNRASSVTVAALVLALGTDGSAAPTGGNRPARTSLAATTGVAAGVMFHEYPIPTAGSNPSSITLGPDRNMWFTEANGGKIGKITPTGQITEYFVGTGSDPNDIVAGPDGNLWATLTGSNSILKMTTQGAMTTYAVPASSVYAAHPFRITVGPDLNLWFTEHSGYGAIGRVTLSGEISTFYLENNTVSQPFDITVGPDKQLWFTEYQTNEIGRMTTAGIFVKYPTMVLYADAVGIQTGDNKSMIVSIFGNPDLIRVALDGTPIAHYITQSSIGWITRANSETLWLSGGPLRTFDLRANVFHTVVLPPGIVGDASDVGVGLNGSIWYVEGAEDAIGVITCSRRSIGPAQLTPTWRRFC